MRSAEQNREIFISNIPYIKDNINSSTRKQIALDISLSPTVFSRLYEKILKPMEEPLPFEIQNKATFLEIENTKIFLSKKEEIVEDMLNLLTIKEIAKNVGLTYRITLRMFYKYIEPEKIEIYKNNCKMKYNKYKLRENPTEFIQDVEQNPGKFSSLYQAKYHIDYQTAKQIIIEHKSEKWYQDNISIYEYNGLPKKILPNYALPYEEKIRDIKLARRLGNDAKPYIDELLLSFYLNRTNEIDKKRIIELCNY